jgi:Replicative DNA helicase
MAVDQQQRAPTVPPHDLDAEESVLGAMLVSANAIAIVSEVLQPEDFYRRSHATIYETILRVYAEGGTVDSITLINSLQNQGQLDEVGGKAAVTRWPRRCRPWPTRTATPRSCATPAPTAT